MDVKLYKLEVILGKEKIAQEWLDFLQEHSVEAKKTLQKEEVYFETYFQEIINGRMYIYLFMLCKDIDFANQVAFASKEEIDMKHFDYMKSCIDLDKAQAMSPALFIDNLESKTS